MIRSTARQAMIALGAARLQRPAAELAITDGQVRYINHTTKPEMDIRVAHLRSGLVLSPTGGVLANLLRIFRLGLGGRLGRGGVCAGHPPASP